LFASEEKRIKKLVTWSAVSDFIQRLPDNQLMNKWQKDGVIYVENGRTHQQMPMYYQFAEDTLKNKDRLNILNAEKNLKIPHLIIHGTKDEAVNVNEAKMLHQANSKSKLELILDANHTFGAKHPFVENEFPLHFNQVFQKTLSFLKQ